MLKTPQQTKQASTIIPAMTSTQSSFAQTSDNLEKRLSIYYKTHAPNKLGNIHMLASLHAFNQDKLSQALMRKYGNALPLEKHNINRKPYVLFKRKVNHDIVPPIIGKGKPFTSKYTGVSWHKGAHGWSANISKSSSITGKPCYIGIYDSPILAAIAFDHSDQKISSYPRNKLNFIKFPNDF